MLMLTYNIHYILSRIIYIYILCIECFGFDLKRCKTSYLKSCSHCCFEPNNYKSDEIRVNKNYISLRIKETYIVPYSHITIQLTPLRSIVLRFIIRADKRYR